MKRKFYKNLFRDIIKTRSRFLSIVAIIAIGVSFYAGIRAASPDMKMSADYYFDKSNFMDFKIMSTLGLTDDDISEIKKIKGVTDCSGSFSLDALYTKGKATLTFNVNSLPADNGINKIKIVRGRKPQNNYEVLIEERFFKEYKMKLGDKIILNSGNSVSINENLKNNQFTITGTCFSPLYVSVQRQLSSTGNGSVNGFIYILPSVFKRYVYTEAYVRCDSRLSKTSLMNNNEYKKFVEDIEKEIKKLGIKRSEIRYVDVLKNSREGINEAKTQIKNLKAETDKKFKDSYKKLDAARINIEKGRIELNKNGALFNKKITDGEKEIENVRDRIRKSQSDLNSAKKQAADRIASGMAARLKYAKLQMVLNPYNKKTSTKYYKLKTIFDNDIHNRDFDCIYASLKSNGLINDFKSYFDIDTLKIKFDKAQNEINSGWKQLIDEKIKLEAFKKEESIKLSEVRDNFNDSEIKVVQNTEKLNYELQNADLKFKSSQEEIKNNSDKINNIKKPEWYVLGRSFNIGYEAYREDSDRIDRIGRVFPLVFFGVAALISLTTMTRMVEEKRCEVGIFKALGYSRCVIASHYLIYSLLASVSGSLLGLSFGFRVFPPFIMDSYSILYDIPYSINPFNFRYSLTAFLLAVLLTSLSSIAAVFDELTESPASLMRPKSPIMGKLIFLEKLSFIWDHLTFSKKVTARNVFRYKERFIMTVTGIAACTGLMVTGFALKGATIGAIDRQFNIINRYDLQASLMDNVNYTKKNELYRKIINNTNMKSILFTYIKNCTVKSNTDSLDAYVVVPEYKNELNKYINLNMNRRIINLGDNGAVITWKLSKLINKKAGDTFEIQINDRTVKIKIADVTEQYLQHYIYMSQKYYEHITNDKSGGFNSFYGLLNNESKIVKSSVSKAIASSGSISSLGFRREAQTDMDKEIRCLNLVTLILIASAAVLAFVVIYNLTNINISERKRELATIKLLGFYNHELALYIYRENIILTCIGCVLGIGFGILLNKYVVTTAETSIFMFLRTINPVYFLYSILFTIVFSIIVNLAMYKNFDRIDMIESLKSTE